MRADFEKVRTLRVIALCALLLSHPQSAFSEYVFDGNKLDQFCKEDRMLAAYYVGGAWDSFSMVKTAQNPNWICPEVITSLKQLSDISCAYVDEHPEKREMPAPALVALSVMDAYSCERN